MGNSFLVAVEKEYSHVFPHDSNVFVHFVFYCKSIIIISQYSFRPSSLVHTVLMFSQTRCVAEIAVLPVSDICETGAETRDVLIEVKLSTASSPK